MAIFCCGCPCIDDEIEMEYDDGDALRDADCPYRKHMFSFQYEEWLLRDRGLDGHEEQNDQN